MKKVLFVCRGNICRSPMAEFVMKDKVEKAGLSQAIYVESAATSTEEIGNPVYPPSRKTMAKHGISCEGKTSRQIRRSDYDFYDYIIGMDAANMRDLKRAFGGDPAGKLFALLDFTAHPGSILDPWYTGDFDKTWDEVNLGCDGLLARITEELGVRS